MQIDILSGFYHIVYVVFLFSCKFFWFHLQVFTKQNNTVIVIIHLMRMQIDYNKRLLLYFILFSYKFVVEKMSLIVCNNHLKIIDKKSHIFRNLIQKYLNFKLYCSKPIFDTSKLSADIFSWIWQPCALSAFFLSSVN
jgi:hypothetical protein